MISRLVRATLLASVAALPSYAAAQVGQVQLEELVVTATKEGATNVQRVPIAVTAVSETTLERSLVSDVRGLTQLAPSTVVSANATYAQIYIRGIGSNNVFNGTDPSSTVHVDGVYYARPFSQFASYLDVERVEILRGPQGTLYGRNSVGGTVNVVSIAPSADLRAKAQLVVGNYDRFDASAYASGPISDILQASIAAGYSRHDAYRENVVASGNDVESLDRKSGRAQLRFRPVNWLDATTRIDTEIAKGALAGYVPLAPFTAATNSVLGNPNKIALNVANSYRVKNRGLAEEITLSPWSNVELKSITAYREASSAARADSDQTDLNNTITNIADDQDQFSQELNLIGKTDRLRFVIGAYYFEEGIDTNLIIEARAAGLLVKILPSSKTESKSVFAQGTYDLTPTVSATAGVRYTDETKTFDQNYGVALAATGAYLGGFPLLYRARMSDTALTPKFVLEWRPQSDVMLYASATRGFKSGGFNLTSTRPDQGFAPEYLWSYEAGAKTELLDRRLRLNATAFFYDYSNLQVQAFIRPGVSDITNAASARVKGLELEVGFKPIRELELSANFAWLDARFNRYPAAPIAGGATIDASGNRLSNAPEHTVNMVAQYDHYLASDDAVFVRGEAAWRDRTYFTAENLKSKSQEAYGLLNGSVGWRRADSSIELALWARNLLDEEYIIGTSDVAAVLGGLPGEPRTFGLRLTARR